MRKTIASLSMFLTLFSINTFAANSSPRQKAVLKLDSFAATLSLAFSPDSQSVASGGWPSHAILWDVASEKRKTTFTRHSGVVNSLIFSPDGSTLAVGGDDRTVRLWDVASGQMKVILRGHTERVSSVAFSPDGSTLASVSFDRTVRLWDVASRGQMKAILIGHSGVVNSIAFSPDGSTLASGSFDRTVRLWDVASEESKTVLTEHSDTVSSVAFSPDGSTLASGSFDRTVRLWDVASEESKTVLIGHSDIVSSVAFSPDGSTLASGSFDRTVRLWDVASGQIKAILREHTDQVYSVAISPDGKTLASGIGWRGDNTITLWDLTVSDDTVADSTVVEPVYIAEDINEDGVVNIQDLVLVSSNFGKTGENEADINGDSIVNIVDLVKVSAALGKTASADAPSVHPQTLAMLSTADVHNWLTQAQHLNLTDVTSQRGIHFLEQLLAALMPQKTMLLPNYPNPFNPETWIPYQLAKPADVALHIYAVDGTLIRTLSLGHQPAGIYQSRSRAAYWDGKNEVGEPVASGVYFYTLTAGDFTATRKMLIRK